MDTPEFLSQKTIYSVLQTLVLQVCKLKYPASLLEVDGIICISFLSSTEQHVVKIHEKLNTACHMYDSEKTDVSTPDSKLGGETAAELIDVCPKLSNDIYSKTSFYKKALIKDVKNETVKEKKLVSTLLDGRVSHDSFCIIESDSESNNDGNNEVLKKENSEISISSFSQCCDSENSPLFNFQLDDRRLEDEKLERKNSKSLVDLDSSPIKNPLMVGCVSEGDTILTADGMEKINSNCSIVENHTSENNGTPEFEMDSINGEINGPIKHLAAKIRTVNSKVIEDENKSNANNEMTACKSLGVYPSPMFIEIKQEPLNYGEFDEVSSHLSCQTMSGEDTSLSSDKSKMDPAFGDEQTCEDKNNAEKLSEIKITIKDEPPDVEEQACSSTNLESWQLASESVQGPSVNTNRQHFHAEHQTGMKLPINMYSVSTSQMQDSEPSDYQCFDSEMLFATTGNYAAKMQSQKHSHDKGNVPTLLVKNSSLSGNGHFNMKRKSCSSNNLVKKRRNFFHDSVNQGWHAAKSSLGKNNSQSVINHGNTGIHTNKLCVRYPIVRNKSPESDSKIESSTSSVSLRKSVYAPKSASTWMQDLKSNNLEMGDHRLTMSINTKFQYKDHNLLPLKSEPHSPDLHDNRPAFHFKTNFLTHNRLSTSSANLLPGTFRRALPKIRSPQKHEKKYFCTHCGVGFTKQSSRHRHERTKCEANQYKTEFMCSVCGKAFLRHDSMLRHLQNIHHMGKSLSESPDPTNF